MPHRALAERDRAEGVQVGTREPYGRLLAFVKLGQLALEYFGARGDTDFGEAHGDAVADGGALADAAGAPERELHAALYGDLGGWHEEVGVRGGGERARDLEAQLGEGGLGLDVAQQPPAPVLD